RPTSSAEAYVAYLRGKSYLRNSAVIDEDHNSAAIQQLELATRLDPHFGSAYADLARAYNARSFFLKPQEKQWQRAAMDASDKALAIEPDSGEAHYARALVLWTPSQGWRDKEAILKL